MTSNASADGEATSRPTLLICVNCKTKTDDPAPEDTPHAGTMLADAVDSIVEEAEVRVLRVRCLANCSRGPSVAISHPGAWSYIFGGIDPVADAPALIEGARLLAGSTDGLMPWRGRPDCLKRGLIARLPSPDFTGEAA